MSDLPGDVEEDFPRRCFHSKIFEFNDHMNCCAFKLLKTFSTLCIRSQECGLWHEKSTRLVSS
jgi:hypothetical protein